MTIKERVERDFSHYPMFMWQREEFKRLAEWVVENIPEGREQSLVLTKIEEAMFWANAALRRRGA